MEFLPSFDSVVEDGRKALTDIYIYIYDGDIHLTSLKHIRHKYGKTYPPPSRLVRN